MDLFINCRYFGNKLAFGLKNRTNVKLPFVAGIGISFSGVFLFLAQKHIPIGTAYAIWTGIGCVGTFVIGVMLFGDTANFVRYLGVMLIICGIITLKLTH